MNRRAVTLAVILLATLVLWSCGNQDDAGPAASNPTNDVAQADLPTLVDRYQSPTPAPTDTPAPTETPDPADLATQEAEAATQAAEADTAASSSGASTGDPAAIERGKSLAQQCMGCHSVDGSTLIGPTWQDLYGHEVTLSDGSTVIADDAYITQSIRDPGSQIVEGFPPSMPPFSALSDQDIADIIAYIQSLSE